MLEWGRGTPLVLLGLGTLFLGVFPSLTVTVYNDDFLWATSAYSLFEGTFFYDARFWELLGPLILAATGQGRVQVTSGVSSSIAEVGIRKVSDATGVSSALLYEALRFLTVCLLVVAVALLLRSILQLFGVRLRWAPTFLVVSAIAALTYQVRPSTAFLIDPTTANMPTYAGAVALAVLVIWFAVHSLVVPRVRWWSWILGAAVAVFAALFYEPATAGVAASALIYAARLFSRRFFSIRSSVLLIVTRLVLPGAMYLILRQWLATYGSGGEYPGSKFELSIGGLRSFGILGLSGVPGTSWGIAAQSLDAVTGLQWVFAVMAAVLVAVLGTLGVYLARGSRAEEEARSRWVRACAVIAVLGYVIVLVVTSTFNQGYAQRFTTIGQSYGSSYFALLVVTTMGLAVLAILFLKSRRRLLLAGALAMVFGAIQGGMSFAAAAHNNLEAAANARVLADDDANPPVPVEQRCADLQAYLDGPYSYGEVIVTRFLNSSYQMRHGEPFCAK